MNVVKLDALGTTRDTPPLTQLPLELNELKRTSAGKLSVHKPSTETLYCYNKAESAESNYFGKSYILAFFCHFSSGTTERVSSLLGHDLS